MIVHLMADIWRCFQARGHMGRGRAVLTPKDRTGGACGVKDPGGLLSKQGTSMCPGRGIGENRTAGLAEL